MKTQKYFSLTMTSSQPYIFFREQPNAKVKHDFVCEAGPRPPEMLEVLRWVYIQRNMCGKFSCRNIEPVII